jgi:MFS family permease
MNHHHSFRPMLLGRGEGEEEEEEEEEEDGEQEREEIGGDGGKKKNQKHLDEVIDSIGLGRFQTTVLVICGLAFAADSAEVALLSFLSECAGGELGMTVVEENVLTALVFAGELVGALFWGPCADRYGRLKAFRWSLIMVCFFGVVSAFVSSWQALALVRSFVGFGIGGMFISFDMLAEFTAVEERGRFLSYVQAFWSAGSILVVAVAWATLNQWGWRFLVGVCVVPVALALASLGKMPESPRWLLSRGLCKEALDVMRAAGCVNGRNLPTDIELVSTFSSEEAGCLNVMDLFRKGFSRITLPLWCLWGAWGFLYYGIVLLSARIEESGDESDFQCSFNYASILVISMAEVLGLVLLIPLIDHLGRRWSQAISFFLVGILVIPLGIVSLSPVAKVGLLFAARGSIMFASCASWVAAPELYPTAIRGTGHAYANAMARVGAFCAPFVIDSSELSLWAIAVFLMCAACISTLCAMLLPETAHVMLDSALLEAPALSLELAAARMQEANLI